MQMYGEFAQVYDALMDDVDYPAWAEYYLALMRSKGVEPASIAECACGTGSLSVLFAGQGLRVIGVDASADMLRMAVDKARRHGVAIPFIQQDMQALLLHHPVDAVLATCDGVNYLCAPQAVRAFFKAAYASVKPGGGLFFDVSTPYKLSKVLGDAFFGENRSQVCYLWQNRFDASSSILEMELTGFVREADGRYRRFDELHRQRAHGREELESWLKQAGFLEISIHGDRTLETPAQDAQRWHIAAIKPAIRQI